MSHGITNLDEGVVWGDTWHKMPQYITQDWPVTLEQARLVLDFPIEKRPLYVNNGIGFDEVDGAYCIVRPDHEKVLVNMVGSKFNVIPNVNLLDAVDAEVLSQAPALRIESVGTLFSGATQFVNIKINEYAVRGDESPTVSRLMYYNPLGKGCYQVVAHNIRVVCNNTLTAASNAAKDRVKIRHTKSAGDRISDAVLDLAKIYADFEDQKALLQLFADQPMGKSDVDGFLSDYLPMPPLMDGEPKTRSHTMVQNARYAVEDQFAQGDDMLSADIKHTKYGMLQAVTYLLDHEGAKRGHDAASIAWDGIVGTRAKRKQKAVSLLAQV